MAKIYAVIVTFNRKEMLRECVDAILTQSIPVEKLILIDNNSTDGTEKFLSNLQYLSNPLIEYHRLTKNIGGAGGFYEGMNLARQYEAEWVWVMDDDTIPTKNCLEELLNAEKYIQSDVSFLASSVRGINNEAMNVPKIDKNQFMRYIDWYQYLDYGIVKIVKATFVSLLINGKAIKKCGLPWKEFFIWGDDSEYTQRVIRDYGPAYMAGKSIAIHKRLSSDELSIVKEQNKNRIPMYFYYYRNNLIGFWEYESFAYRILLLGKIGMDFAGVIFKGKYRMAKLKVISKAFWAFVFGTYGRRSFKNRALE